MPTHSYSYVGGQGCNADSLLPVVVATYNPLSCPIRSGGTGEADARAPADKDMHMPRYFFEIFDGETVPDLEGVEMVDLTAARHAAVDIIADRLRGSGEELWVEKSWRVEVADDTGMVRLMIAVSVEEP